MSGYVRIHRALIGHPAFRNDAEALAFAWLVVRAAWKPTRVRYKERAIQLQRGQLAVSQRDMAARLDRDKAWIERLWKRLKSEAMIEVATEAGVAVITISNYEEYQASGADREAVDEAPDEAGARQGQGTEQRREEREEVSKDEATPHLRATPLPYDEAMGAWNEAAPACGWPTITALSVTRRRHLGGRLRDHGLDGWRAAITRARSSPYLGRDPPNWFNFNWIIQPENFLKLIEGNYDRSHNDRTSKPSGWQGAASTLGCR